MAECSRRIGYTYLKQRKYTKALPAYQKSLSIFKQINDIKGIALCYNRIGFILFNQEKHDTALKYYQQSLAIYVQTKDQKGIALCLNIMGKIFESQENYPQALEYYQKCLEVNEQLKDQRSIIYCLNDIRNIYQKQASRRQMQINYGLGAILLAILFFYYRYQTKSKTNRLLTDKNNELAAKNEEISAQADQIAKQRDELSKAYQKIEQAYHQLKELDEFKEAMSGMIVHDLKNPLSAIIGISNKPQISPNDQVAIRQAGKQMLNLTLNILDVQKFEQASVPLNLRDEALVEIVQDAFDQVSLLASNKNQQLIIAFEATTGVHADSELISRVLMNLLTNAIKYTPNNGKITIGAEENADNQVKISVSDTGQGIPADKLDTVFDKFSQVEAKKSGGARSTGLGLTFCKLTVEAHGGRIWVESALGVGTTFYFTLPKSLAEVKAVQSIMLPMNEKPEINLTTEDKALLQPFLSQLQALDVYEAGDVLKILAQIPESPAISAWKSELERTIFASNQERYEELLRG
jgi:signal transduction histidine kinase